MTITFSYWDVRGIANPVRFLLAYGGDDWEDKPFQIAKARTGEDGDYFKAKPSLPFDFPNLPFIIDGDIKITQMVAICRYLGRKYNLMGTTEAETVRLDIFVQQISDYRNEARGLYYRPGGIDDTAIAEYIAGCHIKLDLISKFLGDREFAVGDRVTYADFLAYETMAQMKLMSKELLTSKPTLDSYLDRIENLPRIKELINSDKYIKWPITAPHSNWGNHKFPYPG